MKIVFINRIFPNPAEPTMGNFVLKNLVHYPLDIDLEVIAPVPPFLRWRRGKKARVPLWRMQDLGSRRIRVWHPRFALFPRNYLRALVPTFEYLAILPLLWYLNKRKNIDCLHANFCVPDGLATAKLSRALSIPYVITEHQAHLHELLAKPYLKRMMLPAYAAAVKVIAVSEHTKQIMLDAGAYRNNLMVIPNGIDISLFAAHKELNEIRKLIYIGYLVEHKGIHILLKALSLTGDLSLSLTIVGDGTYRGTLEALAEKLSIKDRVRFLGEKSPQEIAALLKDHDALVHPSFIESFGIVVVEAMASGLPVLATRNGGSEFIVTEETGLIVAPNDPKALAQGVYDLQSKAWNSKRISEITCSKYDIKQVVNQTVRQYPSYKNEFSICHLSSVHIREDVRVFYKQCTSLVDAGFKVHLVVADGKRHERRNGVIIHDTGVPGSRKQRFISAPIQVFRRALYIGADAYQIHDPELLPGAILFKWITRKPVIYDIHECYPEMFRHKEYLSKFSRRLAAVAIGVLEKIAVKVLDQSIAATEHIAGQFKDIPVVHNYPILSEWSWIETDDKRFISRNICYVGSISRERGIAQIVKAIADVDCTFHLAGRYEPAGFRDELTKLPGFSKVVEYGFVNREQAADIFSSCALGVVLLDRNSNHLHSLSTKMFEYLAAGLPILVSDLPTNIKLLDSSPMGRYIDPTLVELITKTLEELLSDPERLAQWGANGKAMVFDKLSWESEREIYLSLYRKILKLEKS